MLKAVLLLISLMTTLPNGIHNATANAKIAMSRVFLQTEDWWGSVEVADICFSQFVSKKELVNRLLSLQQSKTTYGIETDLVEYEKIHFRQLKLNPDGSIDMTRFKNSIEKSGGVCTAESGSWSVEEDVLELQMEFLWAETKEDRKWKSKLQFDLSWNRDEHAFNGTYTNTMDHEVRGPTFLFRGTASWTIAEMGTTKVP